MPCIFFLFYSLLYNAVMLRKKHFDDDDDDDDDDYDDYEEQNDNVISLHIPSTCHHPGVVPRPRYTA